MNDSAFVIGLTSSVIVAVAHISALVILEFVLFVLF
jgi:hypothetical protein